MAGGALGFQFISLSEMSSLCSVRGGSSRARQCGPSVHVVRTSAVLAVLYLLFSLVVALSSHIGPLQSPPALVKLLYSLDKSNLDQVATVTLFGFGGCGGTARAPRLARADDAAPCAPQFAAARTHFPILLPRRSLEHTPG